MAVLCMMICYWPVQNLEKELVLLFINPSPSLWHLFLLRLSLISSRSPSHSPTEYYWELMSREMGRDHSSTDDQANINLVLERAHVRSEYKISKTKSYSSYRNIAWMGLYKCV